MKITIDTKEDSHEEIEHALALLKSLVGKKVYSNSPNIFDDSSNVVGVGSSDGSVPVETSAPASSGNIFGNMFGDAPSSASDEDPVDPMPPGEPVEQPPVMDELDDDDDPPEVITY